MGHLAIAGGTPVFKSALAPKWPVHGVREEQAVLRVMRSGRWWRGGDIESQAKSECGKFERRFAAYHDADYGLCCCNGTIAVELALHAAGVKAGDEVVVPALSFVVSASAVLPLGAVPVFADCDAETFQPDPKAIEAAITPRTAAIVIVHFGGYPADLDRITRIARKHKLPLIEDCAHAQGSQWRGKGLGSHGDFGTFSFQQSKALTSGEGGIVLCKGRENWLAAYRFHNLGRLETEGFYDFHVMSSNYRLTDLQGALLNAQLTRMKPQVPRKMEAAAFLSRELNRIEGIRALPADERITRRGFYYYLLHYEARGFKGASRARFLAAMAAEGVPIGRGYGRAIHKYPLFVNWHNPPRYKLAQYSKTRCPVAERVATEEVVTLAHPVLLSNRRDLTKIVEAVAKVQANADELN